MRRRSLSLLMAFIVVCSLFGGCGSTNDTSDIEDEIYEDSDDYKDEASLDTEYDNDEFEDDDSEFEDPDLEDEDADFTDPAEIKGIVAMISDTRTRGQDTQIISIDPDTGVQNIISEFAVTNGVDGPFIMWGDTQHCITRDRFSEDYSKMAINIFFGDLEDHAGWIDTDGNVFDVTAAIETKVEGDFFDTDPSSHKAIGFRDDSFVFLDSATEEVYYVPVDDISADTVTKAGDDDEFVRLVKQPIRMQVIRLSDRIDSHTYIGDFRNYKYTAICDTDTVMETNKLESYIPEADRSNWSGVLSPDGNNVAFLSAAKVSGEINLYKMSMSDKEPAVVPIEPNDSIIIDWSTLEVHTPFLDDVVACGVGTMSDYRDIKKYCLLEWE